MIVLKFVIVLVVIFIVAILINGVEDYNKSKIVSIPFKESMDLLNVPIVTFVNNKIKLHFLLDTGSDASYIRKEILSLLDIKRIDRKAAPIATAGGEAVSEGLVTFDIFYKNQQFENDFEVADMTQMWDEATKTAGITIHGILGSQFFNRYKYQIDFENLIAYSKQ